MKNFLNFLESKPLLAYFVFCADMSLSAQHTSDEDIVKILCCSVL